MSDVIEAVRTESYAIEVSEQDQRLTVIWTGTFDMSSADDTHRIVSQIRDRALNTDAAELVINVCDVQYMGSTCLKSFVSLTEALKGSNHKPLMRVVTDARLDWQSRTFSVLARLSPQLVRVERSNR